MGIQLIGIASSQGFNPNDDPYNGLAGNQGGNMYVFRKRAPMNMNQAMLLSRVYN